MESNTIQKIIDGVLHQEQESRKDRVPSGKWNPSLFGSCKRRQFFKRKNESVSNPTDERGLRVLKVGTMFHDFIQEKFSDFAKENDFEILIEEKVETDDVLGFADIVTPFEVVELKTQHSRAFWWMSKSDKPITEQKREHFLQACFYALMLEKKYIRLVYISKDDLCINEYRVELDDKHIIYLEQEIEKMDEYWVFDILPPAIPILYKDKDGVSKECQYCMWRDKCKQIEEENNGNSSAN